MPLFFLVPLSILLKTKLGNQNELESYTYGLNIQTIKIPMGLDLSQIKFGCKHGCMWNFMLS